MVKFQTKLKLIYVILICLIIACLAGIGYLQRQNIRDFLILLDYNPPKIIQTLANQDGMTSYTKRVFYVNRPRLLTSKVFANYCPNNSEQSVVLGCYHLGQNGIFLLAVNDPNLYGIEQVTAAYETLHAIYQRLSNNQQLKLNKELIYFEYHGLNNPIVKAQIAGFKKTEPGGVLNEMTSLFGTEVSNLPPDLLSFYSQYFKNRQTLLNYYDHYQSAFSSRQSQIASYNQELSNLYAQINANNNQLQSMLSELKTQRQVLNSINASNQINAFNQAVSIYNSMVDKYNSLVESTKTLINQYNQLVELRNSIVLEEQQLVKEITSTPNQISQ